MKKPSAVLSAALLRELLKTYPQMSSPPCLMYFKRYSLWLLTLYISKAPPRSLSLFAPNPHRRSRRGYRLFFGVGLAPCAPTYDARAAAYGGSISAWGLLYLPPLSA